ncbi:MAG: nitroreductase family protein [Planctomycetia bacterium]|nr:MAG: nitroreductase family protein [Planctomycetia bacterium]
MTADVTSVTAPAQAEPVALAAFEALVRARRATRHFLPDPVPDNLLARILDAARWAPSGYNLQPTHIFIARDARLRAALVPACMGQSQILEAPLTLVFAGDRRVRPAHFERVLEMERAAGNLPEHYEARLRGVVPLAFDRGPLGLAAAIKAVFAPLRRLLLPTPAIPALDMRFWLAKQAMLSAMNTMLAATAAGLATVPMEGFDGGRARRALRIPRRFEILLLMPIGYAAPGTLTKTRLPLSGLVHELPMVDRSASRP